MPRPFDLLPPLMAGLLVTLELAVAGALLAIVVSVLAGLGRISHRAPVRWMARSYIELFRGTSALVQLFWVFFALPMFGVDLGPRMAGIVVLGLNTGAYGAEVVRGAINAIPVGQYEASTALNLTARQRTWRVILPQAFVAMLPPFGNLLIELLKNTALVSLITISDLTFVGQQLRAETLRTVEIFGLILAIYFVVALCLTMLIRRLERRLSAVLDRGGV